MENNKIKLLDKIHVQKYIYLLSVFVSGNVDFSLFENMFMQIRKEDNYLRSGQLNEKASRILAAVLLDVAGYRSRISGGASLFSIDGIEVKQRTKQALEQLYYLLLE